MPLGRVRKARRIAPRTVMARGNDALGAVFEGGAPHQSLVRRPQTFPTGPSCPAWARHRVDVPIEWP